MARKDDPSLPGSRRLILALGTSFMVAALMTALIGRGLSEGDHHVLASSLVGFFLFMGMAPAVFLSAGPTAYQARWPMAWGAVAGVCFELLTGSDPHWIAAMIAALVGALFSAVIGYAWYWRLRGIRSQNS
jgi:hypothetical protein